MCSYVLVTRINKINEQLLTVAKLQRLANLFDLDLEQINAILSNSEILSKICGSTEKNEEICNNDKQIYNINPSISTKDVKSLRVKQLTMKSRNNKENQSNKEAIDSLNKSLKDEKKRNEELLNVIENLKKQVEEFKSKEEQQTVRLKEVLEKCEEQAKLIDKANNFSSDLIKQNDLMKTSRDELLSQLLKLKKEVSALVLKNNNLQNECEKWKNKTFAEETKCNDYVNEINTLKSLKKQNDEEKKKLEETVSQLLTLTKVYKKRESEFINVCNTHQLVSQQKESAFAEKEQELLCLQNEIKRLTEENKKIINENEMLKSNLDEKAMNNGNLKTEIEKLKETLYYELKIKDKVISDKIETINKQKQLLKDSEFMARQAATEFEHLREQVQFEKETNKSLKVELEFTKSLQINENLMQCSSCNMLKTKLDQTIKERQKAIAVAKDASEKLRLIKYEFQRQVENK